MTRIDNLITCFPLCRHVTSTPCQVCDIPSTLIAELVIKFVLRVQFVHVTEATKARINLIARSAMILIVD